MPTAQIIDIYHGDADPQFHALQDAGVVGVILKATQGTSSTDPKFAEWHSRAASVFGAGCVHSYHMMDGSDPDEQVRHYLSVTAGMPGRWLDFELDSCTEDIAVRCCHALVDKQGKFPGMYGSDQGPLGLSLLRGHFAGVCPLWIARYGPKPPMHPCDLWQFQAGEDPHAQVIAGHRYDASVFMGSGDPAEWMKSIAG